MKRKFKIEICYLFNCVRNDQSKHQFGFLKSYKNSKKTKIAKLKIITIKLIKENDSIINQEQLAYANSIQFSEQFSLKENKRVNPVISKSLNANLKPSTLHIWKSISFSLDYKCNKLDNSFYVYENSKSKSFQLFLNDNTLKNIILYNNSLSVQKKFKNKINLNQVLT